MRLDRCREAIEVHNRNHPDVDHDIADITGVDPTRYPRTDILWASPECTTWSVARGEVADYAKHPGLFDDEPPAPESVQRSRVQMEDVPRFARHHRYRAVIVENVPDILKWVELDRWIGEMRKLGYRHKVLTLNSAFAQQLGLGAPQLRDRVYFVFWLNSGRDPDFDHWTRPRAWCPGCDLDVVAMYAPKPGRRRPMRYGAQYTYRCPQVVCRNSVVHPYALPAAAAIDWSIPGQRIGDRPRPLAEATRRRIEAGLRRYARPMLVPAGGTRRRTASPADVPTPTRTTTENDGICTPMLVPVEGRDGVRARPVTEPSRAQTARAQDGLVVPLRNKRCRPTRPAGTDADVRRRRHTPRNRDAQDDRPR